MEKLPYDRIFKMKKIILALALLLIFASCQKKSETVPEPDANIAEQSEEDARLAYYKEINALWDENHTFNSDYQGEISVGTLFTYPFVQGSSNDSYLRKDWKTMTHDEEGSIFLDSRNAYDDQNLIIYGHYVYLSYDPSGTHKFTPLRLLTEEENYEENKYITLQLENEIRTYQIAYVYYVGTYVTDDGVRHTEEGLQYYWTNFEDDYFQEYLKNVRKDALYDTGVEIDDNDHLLTLQTCVENKPELREIVLAKLISTESTR